MEKIQVIQPTKLLAPYIKQYWFLRIDDVKQGFQRSIPAGCVALVFHKGNKIISSFHKGTQPQSYISGQISTYSDIEFSFLASWTTSPSSPCGWKGVLTVPTLTGRTTSY